VPRPRSGPGRPRRSYDPPSDPSGHWTQVYARIDPVGQHVLGYYRVVVPAPPRPGARRSRPPRSRLRRPGPPASPATRT